VILGGWPNKLLAVLSLDFTLLGAYFPAKFHCYFKPRREITSWLTPSDVQHSYFPEGAGLLVLGSPAFINGILLAAGRLRRVFALVLLRLCGLTVRGLRKDWAAAKDVLHWHGLTVVLFLDSIIGGAADAHYMFGFSEDLGSNVLPNLVMGLPRTLCHFMDGGTSGFFPPKSRVLRSTVPLLADPPRKVLRHLDVVLGEGLFPSSRPLSEVFFPSHFFPRHWVRHPLSLVEMLRLHQLPLSMDPLLRDLSPANGLPFADSPSPDLFVSLFWQLWGAEFEGGEAEVTVSLETPPNMPVEDEEAMEEGGTGKCDGDEEGMEEGGKSNGDEEEIEEGGTGRSVGDGTATTALSTSLGLEPCGGTLGTVLPSCEMTAAEIDTQEAEDLAIGLSRHFEFDFGDTFVDVSESITDDDTTCSSLASANTLRSQTSRQAQGGGYCGLEPHEMEMPTYYPGPLFPVGDVILADVGDHRLQQAFVIGLDHPKYRLRL
jgi:hypothetical protein